jgi:long-chain fatty acid transport protein
MFRQLVRTVMVAIMVIMVSGIVPFTGSAAYATDGHFLHGVGAINQSMGGVGFAVTESLFGTYYLNPAGLTKYEGVRIEFGFEMFKADRTVSSAFGPFSGATSSKSEFVPIPAMAFSAQVNDNLVVGLGGLGIGGFGVDYPSAMDNPVLMPRPNGFGQTYSNFSLLKFTPAMAYKVTDKLSIGFAGNLSWASLAIDPMAAASPAVSPGPDGVPMTMDDQAYYSRATAQDGAFGFGLQVGALFDVNEMLSVGVAYTSPQWFEEFSFNSMYENPNLSNFGTPRDIDFRLDVPAFFGAGVALTPGPNTVIGVDWKYFFYGNTKGFELEDPSMPFDQTGAVTGFGWENINVFSLGIQQTFNGWIKVRGGYNFSQNPIPEDLTFFNVPAPAIVQHHLTFGMGLQVAPQMSLDFGYYHVFDSDIEGPMWNMMGQIPGTAVNSSMKENSIQMMFVFTPGKGGNGS